MTGEIENARIDAVSLTMADNGCLSYWISLSGNGWGVNFGGICLGKGYLKAKEFSAIGEGLEAMMRIMDTVGVERWEDLKGHYVRIVNPGLGKSVDIIGNIIEDKWFNQREFFEKVCQERKE
jgi:hypothetical protein